MPSTKKRSGRKQFAINLSGNCSYTEVDGTWQVHFPLFDIRGVGSSRKEADQSLQKGLESVTNHGSDDQKAAWQAFVQDNIIEVDMTEEQERAEDQSKSIAAAMAAGMGPHFEALTPESFDDAVAGDQPMLVDFWAAWCQPCLQMIPVVEKFQTGISDRVRVASVDVEAHESLWQRFDLRGIPTMILFRSGDELGRILGTRSAADLRTEVEALIS